ncbi:MAG: hypothetical protein ACRC49_09775 [Plesiomonas sp.]
MKHKSEPIINSKLTPTMKVVRAGSLMLFREYNPQDWSFISKENASVILEHPTNKAMYAALVDGQWVWRNGCNQCDKKETRYILCDHHDKCEHCGISHKDYKSAKYGTSSGWICEACHDALAERTKQEALIRMANRVERDGEYRAYLYDLNESVTCPHCANKWQPDEDVNESSIHACVVCGGKYTIEQEITILYSTKPVGARLLPAPDHIAQPRTMVPEGD